MRKRNNTGVNMTMSNPRIIIYGANWCSDCRRTKKYLGEQRIHYEWRNIEGESPAARAAYGYVLRKNREVFGVAKRKIPVVEIINQGEKKVLIEPSNVELAMVLGTAREATTDFYDVVIIGGGPAGLTAALYLERDGYEVLVIESSTIGGQAFVTNRLDNYPGFPEGITGEQFAENLRKQVERFGVEILVPYYVVEIGPCHSPEQGGSFAKCQHKKIKTSDGTEIHCKAILIATGSKYRELTVPGAQELLGINVHYCATCDGAFYKGKKLFVVGGGNSAFEESLYLKEKFAEHVTIIIRSEEARATPLYQEKIMDREGIEIWTNSEIIELKGKDHLEAAVVRHKENDKVKEYAPDGVFVFIGMQPNTSFLGELIELDERGFIITDSAHTTSISGIFAAGDCRAGATNQAIAAAGEGASAAISIREYLKNA